MSEYPNNPIYDLLKDTGLSKAELLKKGIHCFPVKNGDDILLESLIDDAGKLFFVKTKDGFPVVDKRGNVLYESNPNDKVFIAVGNSTYEVDIEKAKLIYQAHNESFNQVGSGSKPDLYISFDNYGSHATSSSVVISFYDIINTSKLNELGKRFIHSHEIGHHTEQNKLIVQNAVSEKKQDENKFFSILKDAEFDADVTGAKLSSPEGALNTFNSIRNSKYERISKTLLDDKIASGKNNPDIIATEFGKDMEHYGVHVLARLVSSKTNLVSLNPGAFESPDKTTGLRDLKHPTPEQRIENIESNFSLSNGKTGQLSPIASPIEKEIDTRTKN